MNPDMNSIFDAYEAEQERQEYRRERLEQENELDFTTVPDDYGKHEDCKQKDDEVIKELKECIGQCTMCKCEDYNEEAINIDDFMCILKE